MTIGGRLTLVWSIVVRTLALLVIVGSLVASPKGIMLAWGVLYPDVEGAGSTEIFDAIVVLSGEDRRIERGIELAEAGRAPVLVAMYGDRWKGTSQQCGRTTTYETLCPIPPEDSTRGEARLIGEIAREKDWTSILVVTGDYHVSRARLLIERCIDESVVVVFQEVDWRNLSVGVMRSEIVKTLRSSVFDLSC